MFSGLSIAVAGFITFIVWVNNFTRNLEDNPEEDKEDGYWINW